ncbi:hypothetical protein EDB89DRAFT_1901700 [Lactarius sanguifluus]|nr:hypothetical protein EDB89DRAFT_1901700 [Lactarius sanguifluus]
MANATAGPANQVVWETLVPPAGFTWPFAHWLPVLCQWLFFPWLTLVPIRGCHGCDNKPMATNADMSYLPTIHHDGGSGQSIDISNLGPRAPPTTTTTCQPPLRQTNNYYDDSDSNEHDGDSGDKSNDNGNKYNYGGVDKCDSSNKYDNCDDSNNHNNDGDNLDNDNSDDDDDGGGSGRPSQTA